MSNTPLDPASQNFRVEMSDVCTNPGTMCASGIWSGSQGTSRLHVSMDWITLPLGRVILRGFVAGCLFATGEPSTEKWPVAPESEMVYFTAQYTFCLLKLVAAISSSYKSFICMMVFHVFHLVDIEIGGGMIISTMGVIAGILISQAGLDGRYGP